MNFNFGCKVKYKVDMIKDNYGFALKFLHTLILGNKFIPELLFDIENIITKKKKESLKDYNQVFITGLARAGTTILLRALHQSGEFASYTYRDMPFTVCPNLWNIFFWCSISMTH